MQETKLGFIGLGIMGRPMALNLLRAGYPLWVYGRRATSMDPLIQAGAQGCASPQEVAGQADIVFTMVSATSDVEAVVLGEQGVILGARPGSILVDMSTISPSATRRLAQRLAERDIAMLDAPVSGGEQGAIAGTLSIMVGGQAETLARVRPLLELLGKSIIHVGDHGAGQVAKACNQVVVAQTMAAVGEALILARASGVDPARVREALLGGYASSRVLETHGQRMLQEDYQPGFKARLHRKDMGIAMDTAAELGLALPGAALVGQYLNALVGAGKGELDSSAIYWLQNRLANLPEDSEDLIGKESIEGC